VFSFAIDTCWLVRDAFWLSQIRTSHISMHNRYKGWIKNTSGDLN